MSAHTQKNYTIFTQSCWLAGYDLATVIRSCRKAGASNDEIKKVVDIYIAGDNALVRCGIVQRGAHLLRRLSVAYLIKRRDEELARSSTKRAAS